MTSGRLDDNRHAIKAENWDHNQKADSGEFVKHAEASTADTSGTGDRIGEAQSGEFTSQPQLSSADTSYTGERIGQSDAGEFASQVPPHLSWCELMFNQTVFLACRSWC